jgi:hypothetical protein
VLIKVNDSGFVYDASKPPCWIPPLNLKQLEIFNDYHRYLLVHGPRMSGKTFGIIHKVIRHAFDVNGAMAAIVCKTLKNAKSAGVWFLLCRALQHWERFCYGFRIVEGPKTTGDTKLSFVRIRNRHGTISEIQCHSLEHAQEVEAKFKGSCYSMFWLSELDQYCTEHAFDILCDALRLTPFIPFEEHQIICDCNPPDTGPNNWMHDRWFKFKDSKTDDNDPQTIIAKDRLHRILVMINDNPQLDENAKNDLIERYKRRKKWYARFIEGKWEQDLTDGHFHDVWDEEIHVVGKVDCSEDEREVIVPTPQCTSLLTGWDMGESKNHSFHIIEKVISEIQGTNRRVISFSIIDELVVIRTHISINQFTEAALAKMDYWNAYMKTQHRMEIKWRHWSDSSAFQYRASANSTDAAMVYEASGGRIALDAAPKYRNSNRDKVKLLWQLLYEKRLHVSAQLDKTRAMFANLRQGGDAEYVKEDDHKHPFDTVAYPILAEAPSDMVRRSDLSTAQPERSPTMVAASI